MTSLLKLPLRAAGLALAPTRFAVRTLAHLLSHEERYVPAEEAPPGPATPPPDRARAERRASKGDGTAAARRRAQRPSPKAARRAVRHEPTRGQAAAIRERAREEEQAAGGVGGTQIGPTIEVGEPWKGYARMSEDQVLERLTGADETLRAAVRLYESVHEDRRQIVIATEDPVGSTLTQP